MQKRSEQLESALLGLFLSFGLSLNIFTHAAVVSAQAETTAPAPAPIATQSAPATVPSKPVMTPPSEKSVPEPGFDVDNGAYPPHPGEQQLSKREISDFLNNEVKNNIREARDVLKSLKGAKGVEEFKKTLSEIIVKLQECGTAVQRGSDDDKRSTMNECRSNNFLQEINDIRQQFVPPHELKQALGDMKNNERELNRFKKQLAKIGGSAIERVNSLLAKLAEYRTNLTQGSGQAQRDALQDWWDARFWDEINPIRGLAEIPPQMKGMEKDLSSAEKILTKTTFEKVAATLGLNLETTKKNLEERKNVIARIKDALAKGDGEEAQSLMEEHIHNGWHPGDLRGFLDMARGAADQMRRIKDEDIREQLLEILDPVVEAFNSGEYREANQAMQQVNGEIHKFEPYLFDRGGPSGPNKKMLQAFDKLEKLFQSKFERFTQEEGGGEDF